MAVLAEVLGIFTGFVGPLIIYIVNGTRIRSSATTPAESLNFHITLFIGYMVSFVLMIVLIGFVTFFVIWIVGLIFMIQASIAANRGEWYRYPINIRFVSVPSEVDSSGVDQSDGLVAATGQRFAVDDLDIGVDADRLLDGGDAATASQVGVAVEQLDAKAQRRGGLGRLHHDVLERGLASTSSTVRSGVRLRRPGSACPGSRGGP